MAQKRRTFLRAIGAGALGTAAASAFTGTAAAATIITMEASGGDIWSTADSFHFYYDEASGDFDVVVHNTELENTDPFARTGIMARESLDPDAKNVLVRRHPTGEASLQWRPDDGEDTISTTSGGEDVGEVEGGSTTADWLRLRRQGDTIEAFGSDGEPEGEDDWTRIGQLTADDVDLSDGLHVGLPLTSQVPGTFATARFKDLAGISPGNEDSIGENAEGSVSTEEGVPVVVTGEVTDVTADSATLSGTLDDLGDADSAEVYFEHREVPTESWERTDSQSLSSAGEFDVDVSGLTSRRYYDFRAAVETDDGDTATGSIGQFNTPSRSEGEAPDGGPESASHFELDDGFAEPAPWLSDDTPVIKITEPTRSQLENAFAVDGERLVVFETSGTVDLDVRQLQINNDRCYVAGQTAPSPGITLIRGGLYVEADDCVVQHVRARPGDADQEPGSGWEPDGMHTGDDTSNNVIDHCTATWGIDECLSVGYRSRDTTMSNCLIGPALHEATHTEGDHGYGSLIGDNAENVALMGNVWAHNRARNPRLKTGTRSAVVNNVMYNFDEAATLDEDTYAAIVGNAFLRADEGDANIEGGNAYVEDNVTEPETPMTGEDVTLLDEPPLWPEGLEALPSEDVESHNLANVGARPADRTAYDEEIVRQVRERNGERIDSQEEAGGYPELPVNGHTLNVPESGTHAWLRRWARHVEDADFEPEPEVAYYQVDFVEGEPIEELTDDESGDYSLQNRAIRFLHGSSEEPITRTGAPTHTLDDGISACLADDLEHIRVEGGQATVEFTVEEGCELTLSLASYEKVGPGWSRERQPTQEFVDADTDTFGAGTHTLTADLPGDPSDGADADDAGGDQADAGEGDDGTQAREAVTAGDD